MQPKRIIIALLVVILVTLSAISISATSEAANEIAITVEATASTAIKADGTSVTVKADDIIEISVTASEKSGFSINSLIYVLTYDSSKLEYVSCTNGTVFSMVYPKPQPEMEKVHVSFLGDYTEGGLLATVAFRVKDDVHGIGDIKMAYCHANDSEYHLVKTNIEDNTLVASANIHAYGAGVVTNPSCELPGGTAYTCTTCQTVFSTGETAALGHQPGDAATCTAPQICTREGCGVELDPAKGHQPGAAATCTTAQTCTVCSAEINGATGHTPGAAATCTTAQTCTVCNAELAPATGHNMGEWVVDKEATTEEEGSKSQSCSKCDHKVTEKIPMLEKEASFPWWIIVIVVVVLVGGFACYWFFVVKKKED